MDVLKLPAAMGIAWIRGGFRLLAAQFLGILTLAMTYGFALLLLGFGASLVETSLAAIGVNQSMSEKIIVTMLSIFAPALTVGFMEACRAAAAGLRVTPSFIAAGFRVGRTRLMSLLGLGVFQVAALFLLGLLLAKSNGVKVPEPDSLAALSGSFDTSGMSDQDAMQLLLSRSAELIVRLAMVVLLWYAPMLVAWHGMRAAKSAFYSVAAFWRNRGAFAIFGLGWMALWIALLSIVAAAAKLGLGDNARFLLWPTAPIMLVAMYCSVYLTYSSVFVHDAAPPAAT